MIENQLLVNLATFIVLAMMGFTLAIMQQATLTKETWAKHLCLFFFVMALQYGINTFAIYEDMELLANLTTGIGSTINNIFLFTAFFYLYGCEENRADDKGSDLEVTLTTIIKKTYKEIPKLALAVGVVLLLFVPLGLKIRYFLFPDSIISLFVLTALAFSFHKNFKIAESPQVKGHRSLKKWLMWLIIGSMVLYALLNATYFIPSLQENKTFQLYSKAAGILFKILLFLGVILLLGVRNQVLSSKDLKRMLRDVRISRLGYLTSKGILRTIGISFNAKRVILGYRIPGNNKLGRHEWNKEWEQLRQNGDNVNLDLYESSAPTKLEDHQRGVLEESQEFMDRNNGRLTLPIQYHGGTLGFLDLSWSDKEYPVYLLREKIQILADLLAPPINAQRQHHALSSITKALTRLSSSSEKHVVDEMTKVVYRHLKPLRIGCWMTVGFKSYHVVFEDELKPIHYETSQDLFEQACRRGLGEDVQVHTIALRAQEDILIGKVVLVYGPKDEPGRPSLGFDWLFRESIGNLMTRAYMESYRAKTWDFIHKLQQAFIGLASVDAWFQAIQKSVADTQLLWVCGRYRQNGDEEPHRFGEAKHHSIIDHSDTLKEGGPGYEEKRLPEEKISIIRLEQPIEDTRVVVKLQMNKRRCLWIGLSRQGFGIELNNPSWPWSSFFHRLMRHANDALDRIEHEELLQETNEVRAVSTAAITTGSLMHQIGNQVNGIRMTLDGIEEDRAIGAYKLPADLQDQLGAMNRSVYKLSEVVGKINGITRLDSERPSNLLRCIEEATAFYADTLKRQGITLEVDVADDCWVDMPAHVPTLAFANLIGNSIRAIREQRKTGLLSSSGKIKITTQSEQGYFMCRIEDDGPGVKPEITEKIFDLHVSTRKGSHGLGLYLTRRSLSESGGSIKLTRSRPGSTVFQLQLPIVTKEELAPCP